MMKRLVVILAALICSLLLAACARSMGGNATQAESLEVQEAMMEEFAFADEGGRGTGAPLAPSNIAMDADDTLFDTEVQQAQQIDRLIIRTGVLNIEAEDTRETQAEIEAIVARYTDEGAFVVTSNESGGAGERDPSISMSVRVPSSEFSTVMDEIADLGVEVNFRDESAQDVTEEFVDLSARIESLETARDRLLEIIQEAQTTEDLLLAEQQLTQREAELESLKGRAQFLQESARLSSISVSIDPFILSQPIDNRWNPSITVRRAFDNLVEGMQDLVDFLIAFTISVLPFLLFWGLIIYIVVRVVLRIVRNRRARRKQQQELAPPPEEEE